MPSMELHLPPVGSEELFDTGSSNFWNMYEGDSATLLFEYRHVWTHLSFKVCGSKDSECSPHSGVNSTGSRAGTPSRRKMPIKMIVLENPAAVHIPVSIPLETTFASDLAT